MKILSAYQIREADQYTIANEPIDSIDLMERAAKAFIDYFLKLYLNQPSVSIFCGVGNNGGDGLAIGRMLFEKGHKVQIFTIGNLGRTSEDFFTNNERLEDLLEVEHIESEVQFPEIDPCDIIIDAIFGSGLDRPIEGLIGQLVDYLNSSGNDIVSVDIASGLSADKDVGGDSVITPTTLFLFNFLKTLFSNHPMRNMLANGIV